MNMSNEIKLKDGSIVKDSRLGRIFQADPRNKEYRIRTLLDQAKKLSPRTRYWNTSVRLDQGTEGACTGFAMAHHLAIPPRRRKEVDNALGTRIYDLARDNDEWAGSDYSGSSVLGAAKAMEILGFLEEYRWAFSLETLILTLSNLGSMVMGTDWLSDMFDTDKDGFIHAGGNIEGGHSYALDGVNIERKEFRGLNSWGRDWGRQGRFKISFDDMEQLLKANGEACIAIKKELLKKLLQLENYE